jgi:hypothetical protein
VNARAVFTLPNGVVIVNVLTRMNPALDVAFFFKALVGNDEVDRLPQGLARSVAEHLLSSGIPGVDVAIQIFAVYSNGRGLDDRCEMRRFVELFLSQRSLPECVRSSWQGEEAPASRPSRPQTSRQGRRFWGTDRETF